MELNFKTIKALSSPTRIKILDQLLDNTATPTDLSRELDKSKSTISSHLSVLVDAELVEKEDVEGRRRVVYSPTSKASAIVKGRERRIKFSVSSAIVSSLLLLGTGWTLFGRLMEGTTQPAESAIGTMNMESSGMNAMDGATSGEGFLASVSVELLVVAGSVFALMLFVSLAVFFLSRAINEQET